MEQTIFNKHNGFFILFLFLGLLVNTIVLQSQSIRLDESQSLWISTKSIFSILKFTAEDVHVPLYNLTLHFWVQTFGNNIHSARLLSFMFFLINLPVLYKLAKDFFNGNVAVLTVSLFVLSPFIIWFTSEVRMYTLFTLVATINNLFFLKFIRSEGLQGKLGYLLSTVTGFYTHYFFIFILITQIIYITWISFRRFDQVNKRKFFYTYTAFVLLALICFIPWIGYALSLGFAANTQPVIPSPTTFNIFQTIVNFLFGFQPQGIQSVLISLWPIIIIVIFIVFTQRKNIQIDNIEYFLLATFLPITLIFLISYIRPIFLTRYLIFVTPTFFLLIAWLLVNFPKPLQSYLISGLLTLLFMLMVFQNISVYTPAKEDFSSVAKYLTENTQPQDIITVTPPFIIYPIEYSYKGHTRIETVPIWDRYKTGAIPIFDEENLKTQIQNYRSRHANLYIVFSYDQGYEEIIKNYLDNNYELKQKSTFSHNIEIRKYKLRYDPEPVL